MSVASVTLLCLFVSFCSGGMVTGVGGEGEIAGGAGQEM
jgi:hypothetical protein